MVANQSLELEMFFRCGGNISRGDLRIRERSKIGIGILILLFSD